MVYMEQNLRRLNETIKDLEEIIESESDPIFYDLLNRFIKTRDKYLKLQRKKRVYE